MPTRKDHFVALADPSGRAGDVADRMGTSLLPARSATDIGRLVGRWQRTLQMPGGRTFLMITTIRADGTSESTIPELSNPDPRFLGQVWVRDGTFRWKSATTGRTGIYVVHERDGGSVLLSTPDDGSSMSIYVRPAG